MALQTVLTWPDPRLREIAAPVTHFDDSLRALVADLFETMTHEGGVGLAATQIGDMRRVVVFDCGVRNKEDARPFALINPEIVSREGSLIWCEGCMSLPEISAEVERAETIEVAFLDPDGTPRRETFTGLESVCVQHEVDHLDGTMYIDHLGVLERKAVLAGYNRPAEEPPG
jgi:peptide deformylase